jgi:hypothetical protein
LDEAFADLKSGKDMVSQGVIKIKNNDGMKLKNFSNMFEEIKEKHQSSAKKDSGIVSGGSNSAPKRSS